MRDYFQAVGVVALSAAFMLSMIGIGVLFTYLVSSWVGHIAAVIFFIFGFPLGAFLAERILD